MSDAKTPKILSYKEQKALEIGEIYHKQNPMLSANMSIKTTDALWPHEQEKEKITWK